MKVTVDGVDYLIGAHHSGPVEYTDIRFNTYIDDDLVFLDDVQARKHHGKENHPFYSNEEKVELVKQLKEALADNIRRILKEREDAKKT